MTSALVTGFVLDLLLGDPVIPHVPHPVVRMGHAISRLETVLRERFPATPEGEEAAGLALATLLPTGTFLFSRSCCRLASRVSPVCGFALESLWSWQCLAMRDLAKEARNVYRTLTRESLEDARKAVGRIVGRDTAELTPEGVIRAAVETVSENFSDGVAAPLLYLFLGGAPMGLAYKAINTMDSMVGYKNERYLHFGRAAAKLDDAANRIPSRLAALLWIAASGICGEDAEHALRIWRRDRRKHASPNSAQCESACAGALHIQLAGPASYFGKRVEKPYLGDPDRPIEPEDILRAVRTMYTAGFLALAACLGVRVLLPARRGPSSTVI